MDPNPIMTSGPVISPWTGQFSFGAAFAAGLLRAAAFLAGALWAEALGVVTFSTAGTGAAEAAAVGFEAARLRGAVDLLVGVAEAATGLLAAALASAGFAAEADAVGFDVAGLALEDDAEADFEAVGLTTATGLLAACSDVFARDDVRDRPDLAAGLRDVFGAGVFGVPPLVSSVILLLQIVLVFETRLKLPQTGI